MELFLVAEMGFELMMKKLSANTVMGYLLHGKTLRQLFRFFARGTYISVLRNIPPAEWTPAVCFVDF